MTEATPNELRGRVLRAWREHAGVTAAELARRLHVVGATLSQWENGHRSPTAADVERLARALGLEAAHQLALVDMWRSAGSVTVGMPRRTWWHNYQRPHGPVWVWVRYPAGSSRPSGVAWWGEPFQGRLPVLEAAQRQDGLVVSIPVSVPNPPLTITLDEPGWVDFGRGAVPQGVADRFGAMLVDGPQIASLLGEIETPNAEHPDERRIRPYLRLIRQWGADVGFSWHLLAPHITIVRTDRAPQALDGAEIRGVMNLTDSYETGEAAVSPEHFKRHRDARGLSREAASVLATQLDPMSPISAKMIVRHETEGLSPARVRHFIARLDTIYGADGRLGVEEVASASITSKRGRHEIAFPAFWVGPIWVKAMTGGTSPGIVDLRWGPWRRRQRVRPGAVLTTRRATHDAGTLVVTVPQGWSIVVGVGAAPSALDVNRGWWPVSFNAAIGILKSILSDTKAAPTG